MPADKTPATESRRGAVLDPAWEVALRAGQQAEGEQGTVEDELAIIHLLRHARAPEPLSDDAFDRVWNDIDAELPAPTSGWRAWLRRPWLLGGGAAVVAAAAAVLIVVWTGPEPGPGSDEGGTQIAERDPQPDPGTMAATIEAQFAMLEPGARAAVERSVEQGRDDLREALLAEALRADGRTMGGAP